MTIIRYDQYHSIVVAFLLEFKFQWKSHLVCANYKSKSRSSTQILRNSRRFPGKFTQLAQILHDRRSWRSRRISTLFLNSISIICHASLEYIVKSKYLQRVRRTHSTTSCPQRRSSTSSSPTIQGSPRYQGSLCTVGAYYLCFLPIFGTFYLYLYIFFRTFPMSLHIFCTYQLYYLISLTHITYVFAYIWHILVAFFWQILMIHINTNMAKLNTPLFQIK